MRTAIPTQTQYEQNEARELSSKLHGIEYAPLAERKEGQHDWFEAMSERPENIARNVNWLLTGNYGFGALQRAESILAMNANANKVAQLALLVAALDWNCSQAFAIRAWKDLTKAQQDRVNALIQKEIDRHMADKGAK